MKKGCHPLLFLLPLLVAGCAGGGSGGSAHTGGEIAFGDFVGRAASTNPPVVASSTNTVATGITGAFSMLRMRDQVQSLAESQIVYLDWGTRAFNLIQGDGSNLRKIETTYRPESVSLSPDGTRIAFATIITATHDIFTIKTDGTGLTQITNDPATDWQPAWSPDGTELVFSSSRNGSSYDLYRVNVSTKVVTPLLVTPGAQLDPVWSPDGKKIAYRDNSVDSSDAGIVNVDGSGRRVFNIAGSQSAPAWNPDSQSIAFEVSKQLMIIMTSASNPLGSLVPGVTDAQDSGTGPWFSPDGKNLVYSTDTFNIRAVDALTGAQLFKLPTFQAGTDPSWGNAPKDRTLIGSSSLFGATGAGFLYTTAGADTQSVLGFGATTQSTVVMKADDGGGSNPPNLIYSIDADTITYISYASGPLYKVVKVVGSGLGVPSCDGAIISIDSANGKIVAVLPFNGTRATGRPRIVRSGVQTTISGEFLAVLDAEGKNLAPSGAHAVTVSGEAVSVAR